MKSTFITLRLTITLRLATKYFTNIVTVFKKHTQGPYLVICQNNAKQYYINRKGSPMLVNLEHIVPYLLEFKTQSTTSYRAVY